MERGATQFVTTDTAGTVHVSGDWTIANIEAINKQVGNLASDGHSGIRATIGHLDTAGAAMLHDLRLRVSPHKDIRLTGLQPAQQSLLDLVSGMEQKAPDEAVKENPLAAALIDLGKITVFGWRHFLELLRFIGETTVTLAVSLADMRRIRGISIVRHMRETGLSAVPIVSLIAFLISVVLAYQGASQLRRFGAEIFTIDMVAISVLREMGVLLTAIMIAGRSGSAFTAEIGMMKVNEEIDAMRIIGVNPFEVLVLPRLLALMITLPLLTFIADMMGLLGGGIISYSLINVGFDQYLERVNLAIKASHFWVGIFKAPVFAFFIAIVGCMRGMQVSGSAESIGRQTTGSVVQSIFLVLLLDALFSILFTKMGV